MTRPRYMYRDFVSRCILMYRDEEYKIHVSWCILICIQCDTKEARKIHVILMYLIGNPKCILDSFEGTCKRYMFSLGMSQSMQDTFEIHQDTSGYMYPSGYMQDTSGYVS